MSASADRVRDFLNARADMTGIDPEVVTTVSVAGQRHDLTVFDLWELIGEAVRAEERES